MCMLNIYVHICIHTCICILPTPSKYTYILTYIYKIYPPKLYLAWKYD